MNAVLSALPRNLRELADPYVGIVPILEDCMAPTDEPRLPRLASEVAAGVELLGVDLGHAAGMGGSGLSLPTAAAAAVGEAVERYSASYLPWERFVEATASELGAAAAPPESFGLFTRAQYDQPGFPFTPFTSSSRLRWVEGIDLESGAATWLPVELVYLADAVSSGERRIAYSTSSGIACASSWSEAVTSGLLELLERDAFMLTWALRLSFARIDPSLDAELSALDETWFAPTGLEHVGIDLSWFHDVPTVLGVVRAPGTGGALGVGAAAATAMTRAWWKALAEAFSSRAAGLRLALLDGTGPPEPAQILTFEDHIRFYADDRRAAATSFLTAGAERRSASSLRPLPSGVQERLSALVARIRAAGSRCYAVDVTTPDVRAAGLRVVRTLAPGLCSLDVAHRARFLGASRYLDMSKKVTLTHPVDSGDDLNPDPHPFP